jgi:hypothetical protein
MRVDVAPNRRTCGTFDELAHGAISVVPPGDLGVTPDLGDIGPGDGRREQEAVAAGGVAQAPQRLFGRVVAPAGRLHVFLARVCDAVGAEDRIDEEEDLQCALGRRIPPALRCLR